MILIEFFYLCFLFSVQDFMVVYVLFYAPFLVISYIIIPSHHRYTYAYLVRFSWKVFKGQTLYPLMVLTLFSLYFSHLA